MSARAFTNLGAALLVGLGASVAAAAGIENYSSVTDAPLLNPEPENWLQIRGNYQGWFHPVSPRWVSIAN